MAKGYQGTPGHRVDVYDEHGIHALMHYVRHSPTGFSWGYGGSGPADLARCLLIDHLDAKKSCVGCGEPQGDAYDCETCGSRSFDFVLPVSYMDFKFEVVARWPQNEAWAITGDEIQRWIDSKTAS